MAQDKKVFTGGMDKDSDPRLIKQGDYRDALNIRSVSSSDSTAGSVENIEGNTLVPYNFITENNQYVNVESGIGVNGTNVNIEDVQPDLVNLSQTIIFSGVESIDYPSSFTLGYTSSSDSDPTYINTSYTAWYGNNQLTSTSNTLYDLFGPGGPLSSFNVIDHNTGLSLNISASVDFLPGDLFDGSNEFAVTFTSNQPGGVFNIVIRSGLNYPYNLSYGQGAYFVDEDYSDLNENYFVGDNTIITSFIGFSQSNNNTNVDDEGTVFGPGPGVTTVGGGIIDVVIEGDQSETYPGDPQITNPNTGEVTTGGVNIYTYDQTAGDGTSINDYVVTEFLNLTDSTGKFDTGGEFEFGPSQDSISQFFHDAISDDKFGEVFIEGSNGSTTELSSITTNFVKTTRLGGKSSTLGRNNPDAISYSQLEFYFNSEEVIEGDGFSISEGTLTFSGEEVKALNTYTLKSNIIEGKNFKLDLTVSGLPSGNSFTVNIGNDSFGAISTDGTHSIPINDPNNSSVIFLQFDEDFTSSDTLTLTNVRLFLENEQVDSLTIRLASPSLTRFKLAFASSETELRNDLAAGNPVTTLPSWYSGTSISLINRSIGVTDLSSVNADYQQLQLELENANAQIEILTAQIASITSQYTSEIRRLEQQLDVANSNLAQVQIELDKANITVDILQRENKTLLDSQRQLKNVITNFILETSDPKPDVLINLYAGSIDAISHSLNLIAADLVNVTTTTVTDPNLQATIDALTAENQELKAELDELSNIIISENDTEISLIQAATNLQDANSNLNSQLSELQDSINTVQLNYDSYVANVGSALFDASDYLSENPTLESLATLISSALNAQADSYNLTILDLESQVTDAQSAATQADLDAAFAEGAASVDITVDNQALIDTAFDNGVASVTPEDGISQADIDAAVLTAQNIAAGEYNELQTLYNTALAGQIGEIDYQTALNNATSNKDAAQDAVNAAQEALDAAQQDLDDAQTNLDGIIEQFPDGGGPTAAFQNAVDNATIAVNEATATLAAAQLQLNINTSFFNGVHSVDITTDNDAAYQDGVASVIPEDGITQEDLDALQALTDAAEANHEAAISDLQATHEAEISDLQATHEAAISNLQNTHTAEIDQISESNTEAIEELQSIHNAAIGSLQETHDAAIADLQATHEAEISDLQVTQAEEIADINSEAIANVTAAEAAQAAAEDAAAVSALEASQLSEDLDALQDLLDAANTANDGLQQTIDEFSNQVTITSLELVSDPTLNTNIGFSQPQGNFFSQSDGSIKFSQTADNGSVYNGAFKSAHFPINNDINIPSSQVQNLRLTINVPFCVHPFTVRVARQNASPYFYFPTISEPGVYVLEPPSDFSPEDIVGVIVLIQTEGALSDEALNTEGPLFVIESMSIAYAESVSGLTQALLEDLQNSFSSLQEDVEAVDETAETVIEDLSSGLSVITDQIQQYEALLTEFTTSSALLQESINSTITELLLTSTIDESYIDGVTLAFQNNQANLDDDLTALNDFTNYIQNQIDSAGNTDPAQEGNFFEIEIDRVTPVISGNNSIWSSSITNLGFDEDKYRWHLFLTNEDVFPGERHNFGAYCDKNHLKTENRRRLQGTFDFWDGTVGYDGPPFLKIVKNAIKAKYLQDNGVTGTTQDYYRDLQATGGSYDSETGYLLNPGSYSYTVPFGGEDIPIIVDFHNVDYTDYAVSVLSDNNDVSWEDSALGNFGFSVHVQDPENRDGWEIKSAIVIDNNLDTAETTSLNNSSYKLFDIVGLQFSGDIATKGWADRTSLGAGHHVEDDSLNISGTVTNYVVRSLSIPQPQQSGTVEGFVRAASSDNYNNYSLDVPSTMPSSDSDIIVNKSTDESPTITRGVRRYIYNSILNTNRSVSLASEDFICIGSYEDKPLSRIYYFIHDTSVNNFDCILEYDLALDRIKTVYQDGRLGYNGEAETVLNFSKSNLITGVSKIDDILYFTDNLNRPRKINVELGKKNEENIENSLKVEDVFFPGGFNNSAFLSFEDEKVRSFKVGDNVFSQIGDNDQIQFNGWSEVIGIIRRISNDPETGFTFNVTSGSNTITASQSILSDNILAPGEFIGIMDNDNFPRFFKVTNIVSTTITVESPPNFTAEAAKPLNILLNGIETSIGGLLTNCPFESGAVASGILMNADPDDAYSPLISFGKYDDKVKYLDVIKHQPELRPQTELSFDSSGKNNILDNLFQFKYRYIHYDNENTSYSGISDINPDTTFLRNSPLKYTDYQDVKNIINVEYFDTISDVEKIEIVARTGNDGEFVLVDTVQNNFTSYLKKIKNTVISDPAFYFDVPKSIIKFKNNGVYPFVDRADSNKLFDSVPKLAKAQTMLSNNRIAYGNVVEGFDNTPMVVKSEFSTEDNPVINTFITDVNVFAKNNNTNQVTTSTLGSGNSPSSAAASHPIAQTINEGDISVASWGTSGNAKCRVSLFIDLDGINLDDEQSQFISIFLGWGLKRRASTLGGQQMFFRSGKFSMNVNLTGLTTINQVRQEIITKFENGGFEGGASVNSFSIEDANNEDLDSLTVTVSGSTKLKVKWTCVENSQGLNGAVTQWGTNYNGWVKVGSNISVVYSQGSASLNSFKSGAFHDFGIAYFDETNRCSFVNVAPDFGSNIELKEGFGEPSVNVNLNGTRCYNPFITESGALSGQSSDVTFNIYNKPPKWATHYQMLYAGNTSVGEFIQVTIAKTAAGDNNDTQMYLGLESLKAEDVGYINSSGALVDFDVVKGDRIRFISCEKDNERQLFTQYLDFEITGFDLHDVDNPISASEDGDGFYLRIANPADSGDDVELESGDSVSISHTGFSLSTSGYNKLIAEIYRPRLNQEEENLVYYEIGNKIEIGNPGEINRYHGGQLNQVPEYFYDKDVNTEVSLTPATVVLEGGDIYLKSRSMYTTTGGANSHTFACEDYFLNDFHRTDHYDKGRINVVNNNSKERRLKASVFFSEPYVSTGAINGLSNFNLANIPYFDYNKDFGSIQYLTNKNNDLIIFHESKVGRVLVGKDILNTASGEGLVSLSNKIIGDYALVYSGQYGCSLNPESVVKQGNVFYFTDIQRGSVLRLSNDGITVISDNGMKDYFRDLGEMFLKYNPEYNNDLEFTPSIVGGYDPKYNEYVVTFPSIISNTDSGYTAETYVWSDSIATWDDITTKPEDAFDDKVVIFNPVTVAFSEESNRWTSFYSYIPEYYCKVNRQFVTFKQGRLYRHNDSDKYSRSTQSYNKFYGNNNLSYIDFVFNAEPSSIKTYNALALESDTKFITGLFSNMGQHYGGYDEVITTNIAFKKVRGKCSSDSVSSAFEIKGLDTKFYEDVSPGDLIKVIGNSSEEQHIVSKVISNTLIEVEEEVALDLDNNTMLVIDYKTKEGIQYADIPFCTSDIESREDNLNFGDGSDIQGVGVVSGLDDDGENLSILTKLTSADINKQIPPSDMVNGARYVVTYIAEGEEDLIGASDSSYESDESSIGNIIIHNGVSSATGSRVMSADLRLYIKKLDGTTEFLGYPYSITSGTFNENNATKILIAGSYSYDPSYSGGFLFMTKTGSIEGERMKGSYMRTILATNTNQSKKKFNLYAANADVDKSELSNK